MVNLMIELSKYVMIFLMTLYTFWNFCYFRLSDRKRKDAVCRRQRVILFANHLLACLILYFQTQDPRMLMLCAAETVFFAAYLLLYRLFYRKASGILLNHVCMLLSTGFVILSRLNFDRAVRQFLVAAASALLTLAVPFLVERLWQLAAVPWVYGSLGLALLVLVWLVGNNSFGAQLSLGAAGFSFQPSEFVKLTFVFFVAALFYRSRDFHTVLAATAMAAAHVLVLVLSKDLGSALIFFLAYVAMLYVSTSNFGYLFAGLLSGCGASVMAYALFAHVRVRVLAWLDPWTDIDSRGYQITQSLFAIGTGGWFGMGLYQGMPWKIPVVEKDFIFSAVSEELGGIYALCLLLLCFGCFLQMVLLASRMDALFYKLAAFGFAVEYVVQVILTVGGAIRFLPSTGMTLPLVSYGGSSVLATFLMFSVIQGLFILKENDGEGNDG